MPRVTNQPVSRRRKKKVLKRAKGYLHGRSKHFRKAREFSERGLTHAFHGRKRKKRDMRQLWINRIAAACRMQGISYSRFMGALKKSENELNRKMLAEIAFSSPEHFAQLVKGLQDSP